MSETKEEALNKCLCELNAQQEEIFMSLKETEAKLFKSKKYIVEAILKVDVIKYIKEYLKTIDKCMNININSEVNESENIIKIVLISDNNPILIGKDGKNIEALQCLIRNSIKNQTGIDVKVNVDASNYKKKKEEYFEKRL